MGTFLFFGDYSQDSIKHISERRTDKAIEVIEKFGGKLVAGYALLGEKDLVLIVEFPGPGKNEAIKTSVALSKLLGVGFTTSPAVDFETFDKLISEL